MIGNATNARVLYTLDEYRAFPNRMIGEDSFLMGLAANKEVSWSASGATHGFLDPFQSGHLRATTREDGEFRSPVGIALARIQAHAGRVTACAFSVDNTFIVSGGTDDTVKVWAWETATEISSATLNAVPQRTPSSHRAYPRIRKLKFIDEHTVAADIDDAEILVWNFWSGEHVSTVSWTGTFDEYPRQRRYRAEVRGDEICILDRGTGEDIAWLPAGRDLVSEITLIAHPNGRTWAGMLGDRVFHFVLESYSAA